MPEVRKLRNPPITEGLIDIRVDVCQFTREKLVGIADSVKADYPHRQQQRQIRFESRVELGDAASEARAEDLGLRGGRFSSEDKRQVVQFRSDGFTLNRLSPYTGWEKVFPEAMKLWRRYVDVFEPETVKRVVVRYINHVPLKGNQVELEDYLRAPVPVPPELNHNLRSFLTSVVIEDPESPCLVKITQSLEPPHPGPDIVLLFDIEASQHGDWSPDDPGIETAFDQLHSLKNRVFFNSLTETVLRSFE